MKNIALKLLPLLVIAGCGVDTVYYKPGANVSRMSQELTRCEVKAVQEVPPDKRRYYEPPEYDYITRCNSKGQCYSRPVVIRHGGWHSYDANKSLRSDYKNLCMAEKGYQKRTLKVCDSSIPDQIRARSTTTMPPLQQNTCYIRREGIGMTFLNP